MSRTLDEYRLTHPVKALGGDRYAELVRGLRMLAQESLRADAITGDPAWDGFLAYLEAMMSASRRGLTAEISKLRDPSFVNDEEVRKCRALIIRLDTRIETLEMIVGLPAILKKDAERAKVMLDEILKEAPQEGA
jgi:hypothetical protein